MIILLNRAGFKLFSFFGRFSNIAYNVRDIRSFSGKKWKKNLGEWRAEQFSFYPFLYEGKEQSDESAAPPLALRYNFADYRKSESGIWMNQLIYFSRFFIFMQHLIYFFNKLFSPVIF